MSENVSVTVPSVTISLTTKDSNEALDFYAKGFEAVELYRLPSPDGGIAHAEMAIKGTKIYISDEDDDFKAYAMPEGAMASCLFSVESGNCDEDYERAIAAGATSLSAPEDQFYGARTAIVLDPFGYRWCFVQVIEVISDEEVAKRAQELFGG
ncbi:MAG: VOC family protein [Verrucomicrobiota bacterium]